MKKEKKDAENVGAVQEKPEKSEKKVMALPYSRAVITTVLAFVLATGGFGMYKVVVDYPGYGVDFDARTHTVERVIDGDTVVLSGGVRVRLLGIDAPEKGECYTTEVTQALNNMLVGKEVYMDKDMEAVDRDGRLLRYVFIRDSNPEVGDVLVNQAMIQKGLAVSRWYAPNKRYKSQFDQDQSVARANERGLWGACEEEALNVIAPQRQADSKPENDTCVIKGNVSEKAAGRVYYLPGCSNYGRVKIDPSRGEAWFCTTEEAEEAGFRRAENCQR